MAPLTAEQKISQIIIDELEIIAQQNEAGKGQSNEDRASKRSLMAMSDKLDSLTERLSDAGISDEDVSNVVEQLAYWAEVILPTAEITWDRETVTTKLSILNGFTALGYLTDEQSEQVTSIKDRLAIRKGATGERSSRTEQPPIEGRPAFITITDESGNVFSKQKGNVQTSASNIKNRVASYLKSKTGEDMPDEVSKAVISVIKTVVEGTETKATFSGLTFTAVSE